MSEPKFVRISDLPEYVPPKIRATKHGIEINISYPYEIAHNRINTDAKILEWVHHLCEKTWMDTNAVGYFIEVAKKANGGKVYEALRK